MGETRVAGPFQNERASHAKAKPHDVKSGDAVHIGVDCYRAGGQHRLATYHRICHAAERSSRCARCEYLGRCEPTEADWRGKHQMPEGFLPGRTHVPSLPSSIRDTCLPQSSGAFPSNLTQPSMCGSNMTTKDISFVGARPEMPQDRIVPNQRNTAGSVVDVSWLAMADLRFGHHHLPFDRLFPHWLYWNGLLNWMSWHR